MSDNLRKRILLVDEDLAVHDELGRILCAHDPRPEEEQLMLPPILRALELDAVDQGEEGIGLLRQALCQREPYLVAILDAGDDRCIGTVQRIWEEDPAIPVVLCTPEDCTDDRRRELITALGRIDRFLFLRKPLVADEVRQLVALQLDRRIARGMLHDAAAELDFTKAKLARTREETLRAAQAKDEFLANISHELRTPMNAILGFTRLLKKEPLSNSQAEKLRYVEEAGDLLLRLINNVLDFSRLEAGRLQLQDIVFPVDDVVRYAIDATCSAAHEKGLALEYHIPGTVPRWLEGDRDRFRQILVNLIHNAVKFTEEGTIHVRVALDETTEESTTLRIVVSDTGVGIPPERQAVIFEAFSQADGSTTRQFGGLGLGLAICKQLVDLMDGQIGFRSEPGGGSSFWVTLTFQTHRGEPPTGDSAPPAPIFGHQPPPAAISAKRAPSCTKPHVLVVEDEQLNRTMAEMLLTRLGSLVDLAENGQEALTMLSGKPYDLVLMDLLMPEMDGMEAIRQLRAREAGSSHPVPVIVLTADVDPEVRQQSLDAGANDYLSKPFTPETLIELVREYLPQCFDENGSPASDASASRSSPDDDVIRSLERHLQTLCKALEEENFSDLESSAGAMKTLSLQAGSRGVADHAMRVQFAARANDLKKAAVAVRQLQAAVQEQPLAATVPQQTTP